MRGKSKYARKVESGKQMYSPNGKFCCGHRLVKPTDPQKAK